MKRYFFIIITFALSCREGEVTLDVDKSFARDSGKDFVLTEVKSFSELQEWVFANIDPSNINVPEVSGGNAFFQIFDSRLDFDIVQCFEIELEDLVFDDTDLVFKNIKLIVANNQRPVNLFESTRDIDLLYVVTAFDVWSSGNYSSNKVQIVLEDNIEDFSIEVESDLISFEIDGQEYGASFLDAAGRFFFFDNGDSGTLGQGSLSGEISCH